MRPVFSMHTAAAAFRFGFESGRDCLRGNGHAGAWSPSQPLHLDAPTRV